MKHKDVLERLREDRDYVEAEEELRPILDLAADVVRLRLERGWSQAELARRAGTRQANISRLENGMGNPTLSFLQKVARALDTELTIHLGAETVTISDRLVTDRLVGVVQPEALWARRVSGTASAAAWPGRLGRRPPAVSWSGAISATRSDHAGDRYEAA